MAEVRRLVYALGDPVLDSLGLVGAVRDQASWFPSGQAAVEIEVRGEDIADVPAASAWRTSPPALLLDMRT